MSHNWLVWVASVRRTLTPTPLPPGEGLSGLPSPSGRGAGGEGSSQRQRPSRIQSQWRALGAGGRWQALALIALGALGALIRLGLLLSGWPATDSDEGTMGLMALHINTRGEHPLFFYGQSYMGTIQAYLGAALFHLFGASVLSLRLGLLLLFILFLLVMYLLLRLLYGQTFALVGLLLLDLGGPDLLKPQLLALGGYPETLLFGALSLLLALWLARPHPLARSPTERGGIGTPLTWRRLALYAALGLTMGLGWWSDQLIFPMLVVAALLVAIFCRRELLAVRRGLAALVAGLLVGVSPQFLYLLAPSAANNGPSAIAAFEWQGPSTLIRFFTQFVAHLLGELLVALPNITGMGWLCAAPTLPNGALAAPANAGALACLGLRAGWSAGLLALGVVAALAAWRRLPPPPAPPPLKRERGVRTASLPPQRGRGWGGGARDDVIQAGRLALLLGGALTLLFYLVSLAAATPAGNARYLIEMDIALPALVYPLWAVATGEMKLHGFAVAPVSSSLSRPRASRWAALGLLMLTLLMLAGGVASAYRASAATRADYQADQTLIRDLERLGVRHMHTDYWTCDKVAFLSQERITCDTLKSDLTEGFNRYPPYVTQVAADPRAAYVFPAMLPQAAALAQRAQHDPAWPYTLTRVDGYVVYIPR